MFIQYSRFLIKSSKYKSALFLHSLIFVLHNMSIFQCFFHLVLIQSADGDFMISNADMR